MRRIAGDRQRDDRPGSDGKAEIISVEKHGFQRAWRKVLGFAANPWLESAIIGYGFTRPELLPFA